MRQVHSSHRKHSSEATRSQRIASCMIEPAVGSPLAPTMGTSSYGLPGGICTLFHPILPTSRTPFFLYLTESFWRRCFFLSLKPMLPICHTPFFVYITGIFFCRLLQVGCCSTRCAGTRARSRILRSRPPIRSSSPPRMMAQRGCGHYGTAHRYEPSLCVMIN